MTSFTTPDSLPKPDPTDIGAPLEEWFEDLADGVQAALTARLGPVDTGWLPLPGGTSGANVSNAFYRKRLGEVYFRGTVTAPGASGTSFPNGYTVLGSLPAGFRPGQLTRIPIGMFNGYSGLLIVGTNGTLQIGASTAATADTVYLNGANYIADL